MNLWIVFLTVRTGFENKNPTIYKMIADLDNEDNQTGINF